MQFLKYFTKKIVNVKGFFRYFTIISFGICSQFRYGLFDRELIE